MLIKPINFESEGEIVYGDLHLPKNKNPPVIIMCHGLGGKRGSPVTVDIADTFCKNGFAVLRFSFRGHDETLSKSEDLTLTSAINDLESAIDFIEEQNFDSEKICLTGRSFGGTVSILTVPKDKRIKVLVTWCATIEPLSWRKDEVEKSLKEKGYFQHASYMRLGKIFFDDMKKHDLLKDANKITIPFLIIHGGRDEEVSVSNAYKIYEVANEPKRLEIIKEAGHDLKIEPKVIDITLNWFKKWLK